MAKQRKGPTTVAATDRFGSTYVTSGRNSKEAGRSMAHHIATGMVPSGSTVRAARADDRRVAGNTEGRRASFNSGFFAQTEAKLTGSDDVGQGKGRAREAAWGSNKGAGGWTPY